MYYKRNMFSNIAYKCILCYTRIRNITKLISLYFELLLLSCNILLIKIEYDACSRIDTQLTNFNKNNCMSGLDSWKVAVG